MKRIFILISLVFAQTTFAQKMKLNFKNEDIAKLVERYSQSSGQKFILDASVRGSVSIFNPTEVTHEEAFNQISTALALNGFGISQQGDTMVIQPARNVQRSLVQVSSELPTLKPERMALGPLTYNSVLPNKSLKSIEI